MIAEDKWNAATDDQGHTYRLVHVTDDALGTIAAYLNESDVIVATGADRGWV